MRFSINISILQLSIIIPFSYCAPGNRNCPGLFYNCGSLQGIGYPFWGGDRPSGCGTDEFQLQCVEKQYTVIILNYTQKFRVLGINQSFNTMTIARDDLWDKICLTTFANTTLLPVSPIDSLLYLNIFYGCPSEVIRSSRVRSNVSCTIDGASSEVVSGSENSGKGCKISVQVPTLSTAYQDLFAGMITLKEAVNQGFKFYYGDITDACLRCENSGGSCGSYLSYNDTVFCRCQDVIYKGPCPKGSHRKTVASATGTSAAVIGIIVCLVIWYRKLLDKRSKQNLNLEAAIKQYGSIAPKIQLF